MCLFKFLLVLLSFDLLIEHIPYDNCLKTKLKYFQKKKNFFLHLNMYRFTWFDNGQLIII